MDSKNILKKFKIAGIIFPALLLFSQYLYGSSIIETVKNLKIGVNGYYIGEKLKNFNKLKKIKKSYLGTEKYKDKDLVITISKRKKIIIGIYKKFDNVSFEQLKKTISFLMMKFGEPTIEAHDKSIYWFYSKDGKISNQKFLEMKKKGKIEKPILMVKFHSNNYLSELKDKQKKFYFYYIIYSEPLIKSLLN